MKDNTINSSGPFAGLYGCDILSAIVSALDIDDEILAGRTARRFFDGESINEHNRLQIFGALGQALINCGVVPESLDALQEGVSMATVTGLAVGLLCERWDHLMANIQSRAPTIEDVSKAGKQFLRLAAVEFSLRLFVLTRLTDISLPEPGPPIWAQENGGSRILREHLNRCGLTRDELARHLGGASYTSVDNWLDGKNYPSHTYVTALASALAPSGGEEAVIRFERTLRQQLAFARLSDLLSAWIGRDAVLELTAESIRLARLLSESINFSLSRKEADNQVELGILIYGCLEEAASVLLWWLSKFETDPQWKLDIVSAGEPWEIRFAQIAGRNSGDRSAAGLAQDISDVVTSDTMLDTKASIAIRKELMAEADARHALQEGRWDPFQYSAFLTKGIDLRRSLAHRFPNNPESHYQLGSFLGMAGKHLHSRDLVEEGVLECRIAAGLLPNWDAPAVEPGIMLANIGEYEAALSELEKARESLPHPTPHLQFVLGYVLTMLNRHAEALEFLESVIVQRPDFAPAYQYAARCAFKLGNMVKGASHAKAARRLGEFTEYNAWQDGKYSSRRKRVSDSSAGT